MTIDLNYLERLNLRVLMGQWRGWTAAELRRVWSVMDRLELSAEEKAGINHRVNVVDGEEREFWDTRPAKPPAAKTYDLHDRDVARIRKALAGFPWAGNDRKWAERLFNEFLPADDGGE